MRVRAKDKVELLLERGADVMAKNNAGELPLHVYARESKADDHKSISNKYKEMFWQCLFVKNKVGRSPLIIALDQPNTHFINFFANDSKGNNLVHLTLALLDQRGSSKVKNKEIEQDVEKILKALAQNAITKHMFTQANGSGKTPVQLAAQLNAPKSIKDFIANPKAVKVEVRPAPPVAERQSEGEAHGAESVRGSSPSQKG